MHRFYLALSVPIALPGAVSLIWGENWITRRVEEKVVGCHLLQHSVVVMRLFCFVFLINGRQWLSRDCCLSFFLTEKKFKGWKKKKEGASEEDADWKRLRRKQRCPFKVTFLTSSKWDTISAELCYCHLLPSLSDPKWLVFPVFSCTAIRCNHSEAMAAHSV